MPMAMIIPAMVARLKLREANRCRGMIGASALRSTATKAMAPTAATAARPRICAESQA